MVDARHAGELLAVRHASAADPDPDRSLVNHAESPRIGDWTMRSAMTRLAQPEPQLVEMLATLIRRLDAILHHLARPLERHTVICDRAIAADTLSGPPVEPYPDTRTADLARLAEGVGSAGDDVVAGYVAEVELSAEEAHAVPLLRVAAMFDALAGELAEWAMSAPGQPPAERVRSTCAAAQARLDELGVPAEEPPSERRVRRS
ncbi:MAG: hypothetical protein AAF548_09905 [Actinomycetota bacterium]